MNWHVNGRASMPCDAPISVDLNTQTPPWNSPSLLPLMHQHRLKLAMARLLLNLNQYSGSGSPHRQTWSIWTCSHLGSTWILRRCRNGNQGNSEGGHPAYIYESDIKLVRFNFHNKKMEVKYRRVKVGFVFKFNRLIFNYCACNNCNIFYNTPYFLSKNGNLELTAHRLLVFNAGEQCLPVPWNDGHFFVRLGYIYIHIFIYIYVYMCVYIHIYINTTETIRVLCSIIKIPYTCSTNFYE